ncbi:MAG TPA: peptide-methionine (R)-S-oxide reductase MsrB [Cyclobacteriaceae bacterium]|nr:peptide-methionine (R)-S-oxide reductase MsrB [Cyclobacteriaceae bacterium]
MIQKSEEDWKRELTPEQYEVLRRRGTERAWTGKLLENKETGIYSCAACGHPVFKSTSKYDSGSGWPSFTEPYSEDAVKVQPDRSFGMVREEIVCANCDSHLGHRFPDGPRDRGGERYCINSVSLDFKKQDPDQAG